MTKPKPRGPFAVRLVSPVGYTFEGKLARLTDARQHARSLLRAPSINSRTHAEIVTDAGYRETMTRAEASK